MELREYKETPGECAACGNSPVNHYITFVFNTLNVLFSALSYRLRASRLLRMAEQGARWLFEGFDAWNAGSLSKIGFVRFGEEPAKARTYRSQVVWEEARRRGIPMQQIIMGGMHSDLYRAHIRGKWNYFKSLPVPPECEQDAYLWIDDKFALKTALRELGVPVPMAQSATSVREAEAAFEAIGAPVVVKPRSGSRGRHTTTGIYEKTDVGAAFRSARKLCAFVSVEKHLEGPVCRGTVIGGKLAGFFVATPPRVVGDGVSSIGELITKRNANLPERVQPISITAEHRAQLARQNLALESVPAKDQEVILTHRTGRLFSGETSEIIGSVHPKLRAYLEKAGTGLKVPIVGFDLIIKNPEADPDTQEWGIIEANSLPFIDLHYLPLYGTPSNPAAQVWDLWDTESV